MKCVIKFAFWWRDEEQPFPSFYVLRTDGSLPLKSNVDIDTINKSGNQVPEFPTFDEWDKLVKQKRRCGYCWKSLRGTMTDLRNHLANKHPQAFKHQPFIP